MKRIVLAISIMLTAGLATVFANDLTHVSERVQAAFNKEFPGAEMPKWSEVGEYQKATFIYWGHTIEAYFNSEGELLGSVRNILYRDLPILVVISLETRFGQASIMEISEVATSAGTSYSLSLEEGKYKYYVKVDGGGNFLKIAREKKQ